MREKYKQKIINKFKFGFFSFQPKCMCLMFFSFHVLSKDNKYSVFFYNVITYIRFFFVCFMFFCFEYKQQIN